MTHKMAWLGRAALALASVALAAGILVLGGGGGAIAPARAERGMPLFFVPNLGQAASAVGYTLQGAGISAGFAAAETHLDIGGERIVIRFDGARPGARIEALDRLPGTVNYLLGAQPGQWKTGIQSYSSLVCRDLYPGIDLAYRVDQGRLKSEYRVRPGADPQAIRWRYQGAEPRLDVNGGLVAAAGRGELREQRPVLYQESGGQRVAVKGAFRLLGGGVAGFTTGSYDRQRELVIDPVLSYSTYLGGSGLDNARAIALDAQGNAYIAGHTDSRNFPSASPLQAAGGGGVDIFVAKLNAAGNALVYCTYLGGSWDDRAFGIAVDGSGNAYLTGWTYSTNFPTTSGARQRTLGGGRDAFVAKLNPSGSALLYSTYLGGSGQDSGNAVAVDSAGNAYVAGETYSTNFPVLSGFQGASGGRQDAFVAKLNSSGTALVWSTYLGGYGDEAASALALDGSANVYLTGGTTSNNFPVQTPLQGANAGGQDVFVTKLLADGRTLGFSTYLGGSGGTVGAGETGTAIQVDGAGSVYVAGITSSSNFPVANAFQSARGGGVDGFVAKLASSGAALSYSTYLGGTGSDYIYGLAVGPSRTAAVAGYTSSSNFPLRDALQTAKSGYYDGFLARLSPSGGALEIGTYLGGSDSEAIHSIATDRAGNLWVAGQTLSLNFPVKGAFQALKSGGYDAVAAKLAVSVAVAAFRHADGTARLFSYADDVMRNSEGYLSSEICAAQLPNGDTFVAGRNVLNDIWLNQFQNNTQSWKGWVYAGGPLYGNPALAATADGGAYVVARDSGNSYRLSRYQASTGFQGWIALGGTFASDPSAAVAADGSLHIAGTDAAGAVWVGRYLAESGFLGWVSGSRPGSLAAAGRPAITVGSDQAAYVATRAIDNTLWAARLQGGAWGTWSMGAGGLRTDPGLTAGAGLIYVLVNSWTDALAVRPLAEGAGGGWQSPVSTGGFLTDATLAAAYGLFYVAGRDSTSAVWWYESGSAGWIHYGYAGMLAGPLAGAPR